MRIKKIIPTVFLIVLLLIIAFLAGLRYGKYIESLNHTTPLISQKPKQTDITPKQEHNDLISFVLYQNKTCNIEFLYPDILTVEEASHGAVFKHYDTREIEILCNRDKKDEDEDKITKQILFQGETVGIMTDTQNKDKRYRFFITHPKTKKIMEISLAPEYLSLIERTLKYELSE